MGPEGAGRATLRRHTWRHGAQLHPLPKTAQIKTRPRASEGPSTESTSPRVPVGEQKPMPLLRFVILKQSTDQRVGVSFVAEDEDELEYGAQRPALHGAVFT